MDATDIPARLSAIATIWEDVNTAHTGGDAAARAQSALARRYLGAIYRYILGTVRDPHLADDIAQDFAMRLIRGDFKKASPDRGRFRDFIRTAVRNLITDHYRKPTSPNTPDNFPEPACLPEEKADDFLDRWREELFDRAWEGLFKQQRESGQPFHTLLRLKSANPEMRSAQLAEVMTQETGKPHSEAGVRKTLQRAREAYARLLLEEVGRSIQSDELSEIEEELIDLGLYAYCKSELERRRGG